MCLSFNIMNSLSAFSSLAFGCNLGANGTSSQVKEIPLKHTCPYSNNYLFKVILDTWPIIRHIKLKMMELAYTNAFVYK